MSAAIDVRGKLGPNPADTPTAYIEAIPKKLQTPSSTGDSVTLRAWTGPSSADVTVSILLYASLSASPFTAFLAMHGKQCLNRYARRQGGLAAEGCEDRQQRFSGLPRWPLGIVIESLPVLLQFSPLLPGAALSRFFWDANRASAPITAGFTVYYVLYYACIVIAGTLSSKCPFQTPLSLILGLSGSTFSPTKPSRSFSKNPKDPIPVPTASF